MPTGSGWGSGHRNLLSGAISFVSAIAGRDELDREDDFEGILEATYRLGEVSGGTGNVRVVLWTYL